MLLYSNLLGALNITEAGYAVFMCMGDLLSYIVQCTTVVITNLSTVMGSKWYVIPNDSFYLYTNCLMLELHMNRSKAVQWC